MIHEISINVNKISFFAFEMSSEPGFLNIYRTFVEGRRNGVMSGKIQIGALKREKIILASGNFRNKYDACIFLTGLD